jgi:transposase
MDVHKEFCVATQMDKEGNVIEGPQRIETSTQALQEHFSTLDEATVAIESTGVWEYVYEILDSLGLDVKLVNPVKARAIAEAKIKTDTVDSQILAHLLRSNLIPEVYTGTKDMRELKRLVKERVFLKKQTTRLKNRIHSELLRRGIQPEMNIFTQHGRTYLRQLEISSVKRELNILESVEEELSSLDRELHGYRKDNHDVHLLTTMPGIGDYTALSIVSVIGDIDRFSSSEKLSAYLGLVPSTHQSGGTTYHGHITKEGPAHVRWLLIQSAWTHVRYCKESFLSAFYRRIANKKGKRKAIVATARKMTRVIYWMLRKQEPFHVEGYELHI